MIGGRIGETPADGVRVTRLDLGSDQFLVLSVKTDPGASLSTLTPAEREVVRDLLQGSSNAEIATSRQTSERTVANQIAAVFRKLSVSSRGELAALLSGERPR